MSAGQRVSELVTDRTETEVTLDANHPRAVVFDLADSFCDRSGEVVTGGTEPAQQGAVVAGAALMLVVVGAAVAALREAPGRAAVDFAAVVFFAATVFLVAVDFAAAVFARGDVPVVPDGDRASPVPGVSAAVSVVLLLAAGDTESLSLSGHGVRPRGNTPMTLSSPCSGQCPARRA